jgi:hypothetical protein
MPTSQSIISAANNIVTHALMVTWFEALRQASKYSPNLNPVSQYFHIYTDLEVATTQNTRYHIRANSNRVSTMLYTF